MHYIRPILENRIAIYIQFSVVFLLCLPSLECLSQPTAKIHPSSISKEIDQPTITSIFLDRTGFLWIGTQQGLYKFDGAEVHRFDTNLKGIHYIPYSDIRGIEEDHNNNLIVATFGGGLLRYSLRDGVFSNFDYSSSDKNRFLTGIFLSPDEHLLVSTKTSLDIVDIRSGNKLSWLDKELAMLSIGRSTCFSDGQAGTVLVGSENGVYQISIESRSVHKIFPDDESKHVTALEIGPGSILYIGTNDGELFSYDLIKNAVRSQLQVNSNSELSITDLKYADNQIFVGTTNGFYHGTLLPEKLFRLDDNSSGLSSNHITALGTGSKTFWIGTYQGLYHLSYRPLELFNQVNSSVYNDILAFEVDNQGSLWVGTYNGLFKLEEPSGQHIAVENSLGTDLIDRRIMTLAAKDSEMWIGFRDGGVQIVNPSAGTSRIPQIPGISSFAVTKILHTSDNNTWIATYNKGTYRISKQQLFTYEIPDITPITILFEGIDGDLFAASEQSLYFFNPHSDSFELLSLEYPHTSDDPMILSLNQMPNGNLLVGTKDWGMFYVESEQLSKAAPLLKAFGSPEEIGRLTVYGIQLDNRENIWISTQQGVAKLNFQGKLLSRFRTSDGLQGEDFNFGATFMDSLGRIYFGGTQGYNRFTPSNKIITPPPDRVLLTNIELFGKLRTSLNPISSLDRLELSYHFYLVKFSFSVLDFIDPSKNQYRYKLEGFDPEWIENGNRNTATYTNLPPGDYVFQVQGANSAGIWNREGASLKVTVLPPPWLTWWAFCLYAIGFFGALGLGMRAYTINALKEKAIQQANEMQEAAERVEDELQEQQEFQDELITALHRHNVSTLALLEECYSNDPKGGRIHAMHLLERCYHHEGDALYADMRKFTDLVANFVLDEATCPTDNITTINAVDCHLLEAGVASPIAVVIYELLSNAVQHAFPESKDTNFIQVDLENTTDETSGERDYLLSVSVNGRGMDQENWSNPVPGSGIAVIQAMAENLGATLTLSADSGDTRVALQFPETPIQPH